jgi:hypothetical protein
LEVEATAIGVGGANLRRLLDADPGSSLAGVPVDQRDDAGHASGSQRPGDVSLGIGRVSNDELAVKLNGVKVGVSPAWLRRSPSN